MRHIPLLVPAKFAIRTVHLSRDLSGAIEGRCYCSRNSSRAIQTVGSYASLITLSLSRKPWIPAGKCGTKAAIDQLSADLQEGMCAHR